MRVGDTTKTLLLNVVPLSADASPLFVGIGQDITERDYENRYQQFRNELRQRLGSAYRPELFQEQLMRRQVLDRMIDDLVIEQASRGCYNDMSSFSELLLLPLGGFLLELDLDLFSSAVKLNTQYMHSIWFQLTFSRDYTMDEVLNRLKSNPLVATTVKRDANLIFSFGRDHGYYGRILSQTVVVTPTLRRGLISYAHERPTQVSSTLEADSHVPRYVSSPGSLGFRSDRRFVVSRRSDSALRRVRKE